MNLNELVDISNKYGSDPRFALAGGSNISCKNDRNLFINEYGASLTNIDANGFVRMEREKIKAIWEKSYSGKSEEVEIKIHTDLMDARGREEYLKKPSVEVLLHDIIPQIFILHVYPAIDNGITCSNEGKINVNRIFGERALWVAACRPGCMLTLSVKKSIDEYRSYYVRNPSLIFVENYGIFFAADTVMELETLVDQTIKSIGEAISLKPDFSQIMFDNEKAMALAPAIRMLAKVGSTSIVSFRTNVEIKKFVSSPKAFSALISAYTPEQIIYCMAKPLFIEADGDIEAQYDKLEEGIHEYRNQYQYPPKIVVIEGLGFYACGKDKKDADITADVFLEAIKIAVYARAFGGPKFMANESIEHVNSWEVEKYNRKIGTGEENLDSIAEKIAIVTGGAQGFGKGISEELAAKGVNVVIADLNEQTATETTSELAGIYGKERISFFRTDIADENSTKELIMRTVLKYGGLDIYINNAGINKPGGLEEMDNETFERINRVNYTAYFWATKYASRIMKIQHRYAPDHYMDIIQINSKSGISGSNKNFAYSGSKFAGIGLSQSFALELVEYNIKVNAICPGNFFESPLWSDPEKGMFVQYLRAGKIQGAKTVEDIRRSYESKVPMKRGCKAKDVARAVIYIIKQEYETGQAIPVTGGQQMLK